METSEEAVAVSNPPSDIRQSLEALLVDTVANASAALGYAVTSILFGEAVEVTLEKGTATFVLRLRPAGDDAPCFRTTARFKISHRGAPPDKLGYALLDAACAQLEVWERSLPDDAHANLFTPTPLSAIDTTAHGSASLDSATEALLAQATFHSIYGDWLEVRERQLAARFGGLKPVGRKNILLVNATKGLQFYPSVADFFALLQRTQEGMRVTSASYFDDIFQFHEGVAGRGLRVVSVAEVMSWCAAEVNRFDIVMLIGPSDVMAKLMVMEGVSATLVLLDLGFYHQLLESYPGWTPGSLMEIFHDKSSQVNSVVGYSCQPEAKIAKDFPSMCSSHLLHWQWFNYIPIGFTYCTYYRASRPMFDVALLGSANRDYAQIAPDLFRGARFLFLGEAEGVPEIQRLRAELDVTVVSRVDVDTYARLLALCRCVVLPYCGVHANNVFMSVIDAVASGKALVSPRHAGLARLERNNLPAVFYDASASDLFRQVDDLFRRDGRLQDIEARSIAFAKDHLDIYQILWTILQEQIL